MATLLPPPKRPKLYHGVPEPPKEEPTPTPNIVVHFVSEDDGRSLAPAVNIPANVTRQALELLVNKLSPEVGVPLSRLPFD
jgi:ribosome assembly protein 4